MSFEDDYSPDQKLLFHFTNRIKCFESILPSMCLRFSYRKDFDDIAESSQINIIGHGPSIQTEVERLKIINNQSRLQDFINNDIQVLCFCKNENNIIPAFILKPRMWSQYSRGQDGVCLIFDENTFVEQVYIQLESKYTQVNDVSYLAYPLYNGNLDIDDEELLKIDNDEDFYKKIRDITSKICFQKNSDYINENEKRFLYLKKDKNVEVVIKNSLIGIALGVKFPEYLNPLINYYKAKLNLNIYRLGIINGYPYLGKE